MARLSGSTVVRIWGPKFGTKIHLMYCALHKKINYRKSLETITKNNEVINGNKPDQVCQNKG